MTNTLARITTALLLPAVLLLAVACDDGGNAPPPGAAVSPTAAAPGGGYPVEAARSDGKTLTVTSAPGRIVSLSPGATEILYAIGAEGALAAVDKQADYPDAARDFPSKVDAFQPNLEAITALEPDLVIAANNTGGLVDALDRLGIPVLYVDLDRDLRTVASVIEQVRLLGRITARAEAAEALATALERRVLDVVRAIDDVRADAAPSVYHELDSTLYSASEDTFIGDLYRLLHARNVAGDGGGAAYPQLTQEAIIAADPAVIILADEEFGVTVDSVKQRPGWSAIAAVREGRIYGLDPDVVSRPGPRIVDALEALARLIYPERFS